MTVITSTINAFEYNEILEIFLNPSIENYFGDDEVIFTER